MKQATDTYGSVGNATVIFADKIYLYVKQHDLCYQSRLREYFKVICAYPVTL